jgi:hypothetical protein
MHGYWNGYEEAFFPGLLAGWLSILIVPLALWSVFWMGWALWKAAKADSKVWFIALLLVHTMGILDIIYIFIISKKSDKKRKKK